MPIDSVDKVLRQLITKRSSAKGQITKFKNYLGTLACKTELSSIELTELRLKLAKFEALSIRVDDLQGEIEVLNPDNIDNEIEEREIMERDIVINIATAKTVMEKFTNALECEQRRGSVVDNSCFMEHQEFGLKLPQIKIAKFDGAYFRWLEFRDTFESLIHKNSRLSDIHKFHYLNSYLEGDAARIISNLEVSSANYSEAWKLVCNRYNNKRMLINQHLNALFSVKQFPRESERSLRFLIDHVTKHLRALSSLGQPTDKWDILLIFILCSKLDSNTLTKWEEFRNTLEADVPTLDNFFKFLTDRADVLESLSRNKSDNVPSKAAQSNTRTNFNSNNNYKQTNNVTKTFASSNIKPNKSNIFSCVICNENHKIYDCPTFKAMSIDSRLSEVNKYKLCNNCLRQGHLASECRMGPCRECKKRHNSLLHRPNTSANNCTSIDDSNESFVTFSEQNSNQILLSTAVIKVINPITQQSEKARALLDCGSQSSFISNSLKEKLALNSNPIDSLKVIGIGNNISTSITESCNLQIKSLNSKFITNLCCLVLNELTGKLPKYPVNITKLNWPNNIVLADPKFYEPASVDILIGADLFWDILGNEQVSLGPSNPKLRNTQLGWIVSGPINLPNVNKQTSCNYAMVGTPKDNNLEIALTKFWELEELPAKRIVSEKDNACESHFIKNTYKNESGRFVVRLPLIDSSDCLGDTSKLARKRLHYLEKRFRSKPLLKIEYTKFINEYAQLGHLSPAADIQGTLYYLCHHAVLKQDSESTKLRVVFDGSAPSSSGYALNDVLLAGPNIQDSLFAILIRARQYKFLLTGDIEKMYRQILLDERDRNLQRILWRDDESQPIRDFTLNTVTYGTASASFLSTRCLWQVGEEQSDPLIKEIIQKDFYVDDLITGANNEQHLHYIQCSVARALKNNCFNLRKYKSNNTSLFNNLEKDKNDSLTISESSSTLGLGWKPSSDTIYFPIKHVSSDNKVSVVTKRSIMSNTFKIFDPLGLLSPVVIKPKIILQNIWRLKLDWDEPVPDEIRDDWCNFTINLHCVSDFAIPRWVLIDESTAVELHSFSDASQSAYGACIYVKSFDSKNQCSVKLLCAKSKVSPLKPTTIPRLELCAALLAAKLCNSVLESLRYKPTRVIHWCDSSVVLGWINSDLTKLKTFVANRASEIVDMTVPSAWRYVPTDANPADLISRGINPKNLPAMDLWWSGPNFLMKDESEWPVLDANKLSNLPETKAHTIVIDEPIIIFDNYSSFTKLQRVLAFVKRFIHNLKHPENKRVGILSADELRDSFHTLCIIAQRESFSKEYNILSKGKSLPTKSKILSLSPFLVENLMRVGGRLDASIYSYEKKHPILLHARHRLTKLYFEKEHINAMHAGPQLLLATVREVVWPVGGRLLARRTVNNCVRCRRLRGKLLCPKMGELPSQRVNPDFPFLSTGLDFAGPFFILNRKGRGSRLIKCYLCIFVCLRYKCVHLEAVSDLTKDAFIMTLRRFIARRGRPLEIFSDNGRNFVAAAKEVGSFIQQNKEPLFDFASQQGIKFKFTPAYAPHFGGIWEAGVKSAKHHLRRVMGNSHLTFEEISTLFAQVEAILNSRPLCPLSSSPNDLLSLSPGHFIIGRPLTALPPPALADCHDNQRKRYEHLETIRQHFWRRWQKEYISELQQRTKWKSNTAQLNIGDMVLISEDNTPPLCWRLGRVLRLIPGPDGISRVADIQTMKGCVRRSLTRLCPLPNAEELQDR